MRKSLGIFFLICIQALYSQTAKIDSLRQTLSVQPPDTSRVNMLNNVGFEHIYLGEYDQAISYIREANLLSQKLKFKKGLAISYNALGIISKNTGDNKRALQCFSVR
jgi:tetratricopeptide (TPR) repeat protein